MVKKCLHNDLKVFNLHPLESLVQDGDHRRIFLHSCLQIYQFNDGKFMSCLFILNGIQECYS